MADEVRVVRPQGRFDSNTAPALEKELLGLIDGGSRRMLLDFSEISYISSMGLRVVLLAAKKMRSEGGKFVLSSLSPPIAEVFEISGFSSILSIHASKDAALAELSAA